MKDVVYNYVTSHEFAMRVRAVVDSSSGGLRRPAKKLMAPAGLKKEPARGRRYAGTRE